MNSSSKSADHEFELNDDLLSSPSPTVRIDLWYPRLESSAKYIEVGLTDVRAADSIRIHYDFERDGYVIEQAQYFEWDAEDPICDPGWVEVAFVEAWAKEQK